MFEKNKTKQIIKKVNTHDKYLFLRPKRMWLKIYIYVSISNYVYIF